MRLTEGDEPGKAFGPPLRPLSYQCPRALPPPLKDLPRDDLHPPIQPTAFLRE